MSEKKDMLDSFFDAADKVAGYAEKTLKNAHYPGKEYPEAEDAEVIAFEKQPDAAKVRRMAEELTTIAEKHQGMVSVQATLSAAANYCYKAALALDAKQLTSGTKP